MISKLERRKLCERRKRKPHAAARALPSRRVGISWPVGIHVKPPLSAASGPVHRCATGRHQLTVRRRRQAVAPTTRRQEERQQLHVYSLFSVSSNRQLRHRRLRHPSGDSPRTCSNHHHQLMVSGPDPAAAVEQVTHRKENKLRICGNLLPSCWINHRSWISNLAH